MRRIKAADMSRCACFTSAGDSSSISSISMSHSVLQNSTACTWRSIVQQAVTKAYNVGFSS